MIYIIECRRKEHGELILIWHNYYLTRVAAELALAKIKADCKVEAFWGVTILITED